MSKSSIPCRPGRVARASFSTAVLPVRALAFLLILLFPLTQVAAQAFFDEPRSFVVSTACDAYTSFKNRTEPVSLSVGEAYRALGENKATSATHAFIEVDGQRKWVALTCGTYEGITIPVVGDACLPFFDEVTNPEPIPGFGTVDPTPPPPAISPFGQAINTACGEPGKRVSREEFRALFLAHPAVLDRLMAFTGGRVFADRRIPADRNAYLDDLEDAWFAIKGFDHIFCGEPEVGGSIGGLHFRGRYLQLQEQGLACRMASNQSNEEIVPGSIYTVGVVISMDGGTAKKAVKGYGLTLSAEDILKVVTRAFAENPTTSTDSTHCLLSVADDNERFVTVFVRRKNGIRTFYPDATPSGPHCTAAIELPPEVPGPALVNRAPVVAHGLCLPRLAVNQLTQVPIPPDTFFDADGDPLSLSVSLEGAQPLPFWADFDPNGDVLLFLPDEQHAGVSVRIVVTASDGQHEVNEVLTTEVAGAARQN